MPRRIRSRPLSAWRDPEAVFRARFAEAPYAVWLDGGADAVSGVSIIAAAHAGSEFVTADAARGTVTRSAPLAEGDVASTVAASVFDVLAERLPHAGPGAPSLADDAARRRGATRLVRLVRVRARRPAQRRRGVARRDTGCRVPVRRPGHRVRSRRANGAARVARARRRRPRRRRRRGAVGRGARVGARGRARGIRSRSPPAVARRRRPTPARLVSPGGTAPSGTPSSSPPARPRSWRATPTSCA